MKDRKLGEWFSEGNNPYHPWTKEKEEELKAQVMKAADEFRTETLNQIEDLGARGYVEQSIKELKANLKRFQNPTPEEKYKYTKAYFSDLIKLTKENIAYFESLLEDEELLESEILESKDRLLEIENRKSEMENDLPFQFPKTNYPDKFISPKDKVSNYLFGGKLSSEMQALAMEERGSKKELTTKVSIDFDELKGIYLISNREMDPYDREVHDAVVSLYIDGENEYITPLMIYRTMTGNPKAKLTDKNFNNIIESIDRCSRTRVYIDATDELSDKIPDIDNLVFKENLLYVRSIYGVRNGKKEESIQILSTPILYKYANIKDQISRVDINLLNTPINKNEENVILQGYLLRRITAMIGSPKLNRNILYETIYKQLNIQAASPASLRNKKSKIRDATKRMLDYWLETKLINDYIENPEDAPSNITKTSLTIIL